MKRETTSPPESGRSCFFGIVVIPLEQKDIPMAAVTHDRVAELNVHNIHNSDTYVWRSYREIIDGFQYTVQR